MVAFVSARLLLFNEELDAKGRGDKLMVKKPYEIPTLTEYGTMTEITQNIKDHREHPGWARGHYKHDDKVSSTS